MVIDTLQEALATLGQAIDADDGDAAHACCVEVSCLIPARDGQVDEISFTCMMNLFKRAASTNNCGWPIMLWMQGNVPSMSSAQRWSLWQFLADGFGRFADPSVAQEIAEYLAGFGDAWALSVLRRWMRDRSTLSEHHVASIGIAISQFIEHTNGELQSAGRTLQIAYREARNGRF